MPDARILGFGGRAVKRVIGLLRGATFRWRMVGLAGLALAVCGGARADMVVLSSSAPGYRPGDILPRDAEMAVPAGALVTLLAEDGKSIEMAGPYTGVPDNGAAATDDGLLSVLSRMLVDDGDDGSAIGATRGGPADAHAGAQNRLDLAFPGSYCVDPAAPITLRRPTPGARAGQLTDVANGRSGDVTWTDGAADTAWPGELAVRDGAAYLARIDRRADLIQIEVHFLPAFAVEADAIAWMVKRGCLAQAVRRLEALRIALTPLDIYLDTEPPGQRDHRIGDQLKLVVQSNRDAAVYCFYTDGVGATTPIFPSAYSDGPWVEDGSLLSLPGPRLPAELTLGPPGGTEQVLCIATDRDVGGELPVALIRGDFAPLAPGVADDLVAIFEALHGLDTAVSRLALTVR